MMNIEPFEVKDFSGGITDNYIDGRFNQNRFLINVLIDNNKKPFSRPGSEIYDEANDQVPLGLQRINTFINYKDENIILGALTRLYYLDPAYNELTGPTGNKALDSGDGSSDTSVAFWNDHYFVTNTAYSYPIKIYKDNVGDLQLRSAGLPALSSDPVATHGVGVDSYIYYFHYIYEYQVGDLTFQDFGPVTQVLVENADAPDSTNISITGIPTLSNGATDNFDTSNIKIHIYRTLANGDVGYFVAEITNGTSFYTDSNADSSIQNNVTLYTTGGIASNDRPPRSKYVHVTNNVGYYANIKIGTEIIKNRVVQSVQNDVDSAPSSFVFDFDDEITGVSSVEHIPVILCKKYIYRIDGIYQPDGSGLPSYQRIADTIGCQSNNSIVQTDEGVFFAGNDGFYYTDSYKCLKISREFDQRYRELNLSRCYGTYDEENSRIYWALKEDSASSDNDVIYSFDLRFGIKPDSCFTTWENADDFAPTCLGFFNKELYRGDRRGYLFRHDEALITDPSVNTAVNASLWEKSSIIYYIESCATDFGTTFLRKWVYRINLIFDNQTNLSVQVRSINDNGRVIGDCKPIRFRGNLIWGDPNAVWGDANILWNYDGFISEFRRFPAKSLRCNYKQIVITNAFIIIYNSDTFGEGTVDNVAKTVVLTDDWPQEIVNHYISFENDGYTREYLITSSSTNTLVYEDTGNDSPLGAQKWVIKGYPKNESMKLISYCLHFARTGRTQLGYRDNSSGANG